MKILSILKNTINYGAKIAFALFAVLGLAMMGEGSHKYDVLMQHMNKFNDNLIIIDSKLEHINNKIDRI
jgi:hypothetical protein